METTSLNPSPYVNCLHRDYGVQSIFREHRKPRKILKEAFLLTGVVPHTCRNFT